MLLLLITIFSLFGGIFSTIGGVILLAKEEWARKISIYLVSIAAGVLFATAFFHLFPEASELLLSEGRSMSFIFALMASGFLFFFAIEGILSNLHYHHYGVQKEHHHPEKHGHVHATPWLLIIGDSIHNFIDGIIITTTFFASIPLGIATAIAIAAHEIPQEIGDFSVMLHAGWGRMKVLGWNLAAALMTTVGALIAFPFRASIEPALGYLLAFTGGLFLYISASDLIPELYHYSRRDKLVMTIPFFAFGIAISLFVGMFVG